MNIVILAAGPPKPNRDRHLEVFNGMPLIDTAIKGCRHEETKLHVVIDAENTKLRSHVKNIQDVHILTPKDKKIRSTFEIALSLKGDCVMVSGDLIGLQEGDAGRFVDSEYECALTGLTKYKWGGVHRNNLVRRGDVGDCLFKISEKYKSDFLGEKNLRNALKYHDMFYPGRTPSQFIYNDIGTHMTYAFFDKIWGDPNCNSFAEKGLVFFDHYVWQDND